MASKYREDEINQLVDQLANRKFEYNQQEDPLYQAYATQYEKQGNRAMKDTLAQVSARTGGLASSYAVGAAQDSYQNYMDQLNNKAMDLYQLALSHYNNETNNMQNLLSVYQNLGNNEYQRERDTISDQRYADELAYSRGRDAISDTRYADETKYNRNQDALNWAYKNKQLELSQEEDADSKKLALAQLLAQNGDYSKLAEYYGTSTDSLLGLPTNAKEYETLTGEKIKAPMSENEYTYYGEYGSELYDEYLNNYYQNAYKNWKNAQSKQEEPKSFDNDTYKEAYKIFTSDRKNALNEMISYLEGVYGKGSDDAIDMAIAVTGYTEEELNNKINK